MARQGLPNTISVDDYHEFGVAQDLYKIINKKIKVEEIGFDGITLKYIGLVYAGRKPTKRVIDRLTKKFDFSEE